jgi:hypothetical protein
LKYFLFYFKKSLFLSIQLIVIFSLPHTGHMICQGGTFFSKTILNKLNS